MNIDDIAPGKEGYIIYNITIRIPIQQWMASKNGDFALII